MALISAGTTILDAGALAADATNLVKLSSTTLSSGVSSISFTSGINSTYKIYKFEFINVHPATNDVDFAFNFSTDGGSSYNVAKSGAGHQIYGDEAGGGGFASGHQANFNAAQITSRVIAAHSTGNGADEQMSGHMFLYNPSNTTFVKSYMSFIQNLHKDDSSQLYIVEGYGNTTSAINAVKFEMTSGNIDAGTFTMYGVKT